MINKMTSRERVMAVFKREGYDRPPVINPTSIATVESMKITKAIFPDVHTDSNKMAALAASGHEYLGFDTVAPYFSVQQEAAALGCKINWGSLDTMPTIDTNPIQYPEDFKLPEDFLDRVPIKTVLDAIKILKNKYGNDVAVVGKVMGPWTLAYHLHGVQEFLIKTILEPETVKAFLKAFIEISLTFAHAQFEAGADIITWADHATGDLISAEGYKEFLFPIHRHVNNVLTKGGPVILHTCGNTLDRMDLFAQTGFEAFHFDSRNNPKEAMDIVKDRILLTGCINNPNVLLNGTKEDVKRDVFKALDAGIQLISPECAIPCRVPNQNLIAISESVKEYFVNK